MDLHHHHLSAAASTQVILPTQSFIEDAEHRLGKANGNTYQRIPGIDGVHDGQVMVRLKKKRFVVLDYSIVPNDHDLMASEVNPNVRCPPGAGVAKCNQCTKIGVPVLLHDSEPTEPASLYQRSGLCFTCQRHLNEKRRTQRKRPSGNLRLPGGGEDETIVLTVGPRGKKFKRVGNAIEFKTDAIILDAAPKRCKSVRDGFGYPEIGTDLQGAVRDATLDADKLVQAVVDHTMTTTTASTEAPSAAATATTDDPNVGTDFIHIDEPTHAAVHAGTTVGFGTGLGGTTGTVVATSAAGEDINALYEKAFLSLSKSIYLLTQWKQSWDGAVAAAVAQESVVGDPSLAEAVATAAVVAASGDHTNMASLLIAADQQKPGSEVVEAPDVSGATAFEI